MTTPRTAEEAAWLEEFPGTRLLAIRAAKEFLAIGNLIDRTIDDLTRKFGVSHAAFNALAVIEGNGGPMPAGEVSKHMHITTGATTSLLDTLERRNYLVRRNDPSDRRRVLVDITPSGQVLLDTALPAVAHLAGALMNDTTDKRLEQVLVAAQRIRATAAALPAELPTGHRNRPSRLDRSAATKQSPA